ncbi:hypothetical protein E0493_04925 [Roseomonas sp. M0104]|uniref:Uncharacterized protein n=1 Tax=Teichococcus coralli TaxID=2545983 RepID=A0A845B9B5_9PROT|nr:hypothetical protein [Pseudoroseomonas coralli]MXP62696.1 hypothetical protein [Pseudoroseomonas coralli]
MAAPPRSARPAGAPARRKPAGGRARLGGGGLRRWLHDFPWRRWLAVIICVAVLLIGVPLAHAMLGDLGALLLLTGCGGFALGRATAPRRLAGPAPRKGRAQQG